MDLGVHTLAEGGELFVITDDLYPVVRKQHRAARRYIDALYATDDAAHMHAKAVAELQFLKRPPGPLRVLRNEELSDMYVAVEEMLLKQRTTVAVHTCGHIARLQVSHEPALHRDAPLLQSA